MKWFWGVRERPAHKSLPLSLNETRPDIHREAAGRGWPRANPRNCQNLPLGCFNFASTLQSNPIPIALGRT
jgi:hypothetical protein